MNKFIGILDSGIGGASILEEIKKSLPLEKYVYMVDTKNMPYGNKSKRRIQKITESNIQKLISAYNVKLVVIACNTASICASKLRKKFKIPIVGIEPPIKPAIEYGYKKILILATKRTLKSNQTIKDNLKKAKKNKTIVKKLAIKNLAADIDKNFNNLDILQSMLDKKLAKFSDFDAVVIGCTHYNFIKSQIQKSLPNAVIISCEKPVANRVKYILERDKIISTSQNKDKNILFLTKPNLKMKIFLKKYLINFS